MRDLDVDPKDDLPDDPCDGAPDAPEDEYARGPGQWPTEGTALPGHMPVFQTAANAAVDPSRPVLFPGEDQGGARDETPRPHPVAGTGDERLQPSANGAPSSPAVANARAGRPESFGEATQQHGMAPSDPDPSIDGIATFEAPPPAAGRAGPGAGRARTRLLGFGQAEDPAVDPFARDAAPAPLAGTVPFFPVGWLVVVDGPGRGAHFTLFNGVAQIGRGADQTVRLDFGDTSISRSGHALLAYDDEEGRFFLGSGGKVNIVRLNGRPLLSTEEMSDRDVIRIGETTLRLVAFCGPDFTWSTERRDADIG
ncbi:FHA domain-containing protein [Rhodovulum steppense]|uniref:FHA domain-containing protein n=1 Tax=Rhodovulum steppense TaxID=540251 RepID=UPI001FB43BA0|nr:FHA domain-containing protein [Rhodovulum steppense]